MSGAKKEKEKKKKKTPLSTVFTLLDCTMATQWFLQVLGSRKSVSHPPEKGLSSANPITSLTCLQPSDEQSSAEVVN